MRTPSIPAFAFLAALLISLLGVSCTSPSKYRKEGLADGFTSFGSYYELDACLSKFYHDNHRWPDSFEELKKFATRSKIKNNLLQYHDVVLTVQSNGFLKIDFQRTIRDSFTYPVPNQTVYPVRCGTKNNLPENLESQQTKKPQNNENPP
ncbi:MAG: hypothetical protein PHV34_19565 [Verrucomicrobiae bacterium]|nr:hypothetical protein [Verrucomicrobiae bacterium]